MSAESQFDRDKWIAKCQAHTIKKHKDDPLTTFVINHVLETGARILHTYKGPLYHEIIILGSDNKRTRFAGEFTSSGYPVFYCNDSNIIELGPEALGHYCGDFGRLLARYADHTAFLDISAKDCADFQRQIIKIRCAKEKYYEDLWRQLVDVQKKIKELECTNQYLTATMTSVEALVVAVSDI